MNSKIFIDKNKNQVKGPLLIEIKSFDDKRGYFYEKWNQKNFDKLIGRPIKFVQDNISKSVKGVLRGLHYQILPRSQAKLVSCIYGEIFDVAVDIRKSSPTFGSWIGAILNESNKSQLWIPDGFAHGFLSLSNQAIVHYKTTNYWSAEHERSIAWDDEDIKIKWPLDFLEGYETIVSEKDKGAIKFINIKNSDLFL